MSSAIWISYNTGYDILVGHLHIKSNFSDSPIRVWTLLEEGSCKDCKKPFPEVLKIIENV